MHNADDCLVVHNADDCLVPFGKGGKKPPKANSYRSVDVGASPTRARAWSAAERDAANYRFATPRAECGSPKCHVHLDVYNNKGELLITRHYSYPRGK